MERGAGAPPPGVPGPSPMLAVRGRRSGRSEAHHVRHPDSVAPGNYRSVRESFHQRDSGPRPVTSVLSSRLSRACADAERSTRPSLDRGGPANTYTLIRRKPDFARHAAAILRHPSWKRRNCRRHRSSLQLARHTTDDRQAVQRSRWRRHAKPSPHLSETIFRKADRPVPAATAGGLRGVKDFSPTAAVTCNSLGIGGDPAVSVHGRGGESAGHGVCGGGVGGGWSSGLSAKVELRRFSPDREGDR